MCVCVCVCVCKEMLQKLIRQKHNHVNINSLISDFTITKTPMLETLTKCHLWLKGEKRIPKVPKILFLCSWQKKMQNSSWFIMAESSSTNYKIQIPIGQWLIHDEHRSALLQSNSESLRRDSKHIRSFYFCS